MNKEDVVALLQDDWELQESRSTATVLGHPENAPAFVRRADPTVYRLTRSTESASAASQAGPEP